MSTLTTTVVVLVIAILAGVLIYNVMQSARSARLRRDSQPQAAAPQGAQSGASAGARGAGAPAQTASSEGRRSEPSLGDLPLHVDDTEPLPDMDPALDPDSIPAELAGISKFDRVVPPQAVAADPASPDAGSQGGLPKADVPRTDVPKAEARKAEGQKADVHARDGHRPSDRRVEPSLGLQGGAQPFEDTRPVAAMGLDAGPGEPGRPPGNAQRDEPGGRPGNWPEPMQTNGSAREGTGQGAPAEPDRGTGAGEPPARRSSGIVLQLDPLCDCIVEMTLGMPQSAERLLGLTRTLRRVGAKPVLFEVWLTDRAIGRWAPLAAGVTAPAISRLRAGVLMANRHGPLNAMEFSEFSTGLTALAGHLSGTFKLPEMGGVLERARALDDSCIELDAQVGVNVDAGEPLSPVDMERMAREQRLVERGSNRFARLGPRGEVLFSVAQVEHPNRITFLLDVPRAPAECDPWGLLVACAHACAVRLQGTLVDDDGRPLQEQSLARIGEQLGSRYAALEQAGVPAGSSLALRLFN